MPAITASGQYDVYAYFPLLENGADQTHMLIYDGKQQQEKIIRKSDILVEGQTSGEWVALGTYHLSKGGQAYVEISDQNANGAVVADAVLFVPYRE